VAPACHRLRLECPAAPPACHRLRLERPAAAPACHRRLRLERPAAARACHRHLRQERPAAPPACRHHRHPDRQARDPRQHQQRPHPHRRRAQLRRYRPRQRRRRRHPPLAPSRLPRSHHQHPSRRVVRQGSRPRPAHDRSPSLPPHRHRLPRPTRTWTGTTTTRRPRCGTRPAGKMRHATCFAAHPLRRRRRLEHRLVPAGSPRLRVRQAVQRQRFPVQLLRHPHRLVHLRRCLDRQSRRR